MVTNTIVQFIYSFPFQWKTLASSLICCLGSKRMEDWTEAEVEAQLSPKKQKPVKIQKKENSGEDKGQKIAKEICGVLNSAKT